MEPQNKQEITFNHPDRVGSIMTFTVVDDVGTPLNGMQLREWMDKNRRKFDESAPKVQGRSTESIMSRSLDSPVLRYHCARCGHEADLHTTFYCTDECCDNACAAPDVLGDCFCILTAEQVIEQEKKTIAELLGGWSFPDSPYLSTYLWSSTD